LAFADDAWKLHRSPPPGLRDQLQRYYHAPNVHVTTVHPLWVSTPLVAYRKDQIEKASGKMMTPQRVAGEIVDQIFRCKGARLIIPGSFGWLRGTRAWPVWMLDLLKRTNGLDGDEK
jgi:short-subunit dehydrogenase